jgi:hypothetical protein
MINKERERKFLTLRNWLTVAVLRVRLKENLRQAGLGSSKITKEGGREKHACTPGDKQVASKELD